MTNSDEAIGKRERLVAVARDLVYRQGIERTTLADIADASGTGVGNVYYYFRTKDAIVAAVVRARVAELEAGFAGLERAHRSPRARLRALVASVSLQGKEISRFGCPYGTLGAELAKRSGAETPTQTGVRPDPLAAQLVDTLLGWTERQFRAMGRRDARGLAEEFVAAYQGAALIASATGRPELFTRRARGIGKWIDELAVASSAGSAGSAGRKTKAGRRTGS